MSDWLEVIALRRLLDGEGKSARDVISGMNINSLRDAKIAVATLAKIINEEIEYVEKHGGGLSEQTTEDAKP